LVLFGAFFFPAFLAIFLDAELFFAGAAFFAGRFFVFDSFVGVRAFAGARRRVFWAFFVPRLLPAIFLAVATTGSFFKRERLGNVGQWGA